MKKYRILLLLPALVMVSCKKNKPYYKAEYKPLTEAVYASGQVVPRYEYQVFSLGEGILVERYVNEGDMVTKDQPLFRIRNASQEARYITAGEVYRMAQTNYGNDSPILAEQEAALTSSREKLANDSAIYMRTKTLWEQNAISKNEYDRAELNYKLSGNDYKARLKAYQRTRNQLFLELQNAQSQLTVTRDDKDNYTVRSAISGMVYEVYKETGEGIRRGEPVAIIADARQVYIQLSVDEKDIEKVNVGQSVLVKMDIFKGKIFNARVEKIYPRLRSRDQSFRVDAVFTDSLPKVYSGITAEANIIIQQKEHALVVPKSYLVGEDSLWIRNGRKKEKIHITKGVENYEWVEVLDGVTEGMKILQP